MVKLISSGTSSMRDIYKSFLVGCYPNKKTYSNDIANSLTRKSNKVAGNCQGDKSMNGIPDLPKSPAGFSKPKSFDNLYDSPRRGCKTPTPSSTASLARKMSRASADSKAVPTLGNLSRTSTGRSSTPIMYSNSNGMVKPPPVERKLECTLEELCFGCVKKIKATRDVATKTGTTIQEEELLTINVKPGWKKGTKITFEGMGNERPGTCPADVTFVVAEKRHPLYRRDGDNLELAVEIPLVQALTGCTLPIPFLGGEKTSLTVNDEVIYPGYHKIIEGQGMPIPKQKGTRGNLKVVFLIDFPKDLTEEQRSEAFRILQEACS